MLLTGCPRSKVSKAKGCSLETVHIWPNIGKAKMCLRNIHFFLQKQLFAYKQYKNTINGTSLHPSFHGLEVREWTAMPEVPGSRLTHV